MLNLQEKILKGHQASLTNFPQYIFIHFLEKEITLTNEEKTDNYNKVIKICRERYAKERTLVEDKITRWHLSDDDKPSKPENRKNDRKNLQRPDNKNFKQEVSSNDNRSQNDNIYKFSAVCSSCGKETKISFKPDGVRPIYCKECLSKSRKKK